MQFSKTNQERSLEEQIQAPTTCWLSMLSKFEAAMARSQKQKNRLAFPTPWSFAFVQTLAIPKTAPLLKNGHGRVWGNSTGSRLGRPSSVGNPAIEPLAKQSMQYFLQTTFGMKNLRRVWQS
jgi:hypothetical protein